MVRMVSAERTQILKAYGCTFLKSKDIPGVVELIKEDIEGLAQMVGNEYGIEASEVYEDVKNVVKTFREKGILL